MLDFIILTIFFVIYFIVLFGAINFIDKNTKN